ncbi:MAG TPA: transposase [Actinomycetes bacterium]|nr:transposase [Actinomycetes bacterium]
MHAHGGDPLRVRDVSADMSQAFERGVRASLPKAYLTYDRYHLASHATKAVDEVRRAEACAPSSWSSPDASRAPFHLTHHDGLQPTQQVTVGATPQGRLQRANSFIPRTASLPGASPTSVTPPRVRGAPTFASFGGLISLVSGGPHGVLPGRGPVTQAVQAYRRSRR